MRRQTIFVVFTTQRSGSSWLVDLLESHPEIAAYPEMFRVTDKTFSSYGASRVPRFEVFVPPGSWSTSKGLAPRRLGYVRSLTRAHCEARAVGFKLMYDQTRDHPGLLACLALSRARFVHLVRRNHLSAIVSLEVAERLDRWWSAETHAVLPVRVRLEPDELLGRLEQREETIDRFRRKLRRLPVRVLEVAYEDLVERHEETIRPILRFLGVAPAEGALRSSLVRTGPASVSQVVENYDDVRASLAGTRFEALVR